MTLAKGDNAHYEKYLLLSPSSSVQKVPAADASESIDVWERVKKEMMLFKNIELRISYKVENIVAKEEIAYSGAAESVCMCERVNLNA